MIKVILIYLLIIIISYLAGVNLGLVNPKCSGGVCPPPEGYEDGRNR